MRHVTEDLRGHIKSHVLIYSLVLGFPALKLATLFEHTQVIKPSYQWNDLIDQNNELWPDRSDIESILIDETLVRRLVVEDYSHDGRGSDACSFVHLTSLL
jgi:hypothetical protein